MAATMSNTTCCLITFLTSSPKRTINLIPLPARPQTHTSRNSARCCHKSSSSSRTTIKTGYITSSVSSNTQQPTHRTISPRPPYHASLKITTWRYAAMRRHRSAPERRRFKRSGGAILTLSKPRSARLESSTSVWSKTRGYEISSERKCTALSLPRGKFSPIYK